MPSSDDKPDIPPPVSGGFLTKDTPGSQRRKMTKQEALDEAIDETFPASDPVSPTRIDGPLVVEKKD